MSNKKRQAQRARREKMQEEQGRRVVRNIAIALGLLAIIMMVSFIVMG